MPLSDRLSISRVKRKSVLLGWKLNFKRFIDVRRLYVEQGNRVNYQKDVRMKYWSIEIMEMSIIFEILTYCGIWRPISWSSRSKTVIYSIYSLFVMCFAVSFTISQTFSALSVNNVDDFVENTYILVTAFVGCCKMTNMLICRKGVIDLVKILVEEPCASSDTEEMKIQAKYDKKIRSVPTVTVDNNEPR